MRSVVAALVLGVAALAQTPLQEPRAAQQEAYRQWRKTDPDLERDATSAGATLGARADKVAAAAAQYFSLRKDYLESRAADARRDASLLQPVNVVPEAPPNLDRLLTMQDTILRSSITTIAADPDRAIQQLRAALERERAAITAVATVVKDSQKSQEAAAQSSRTAEEARVKTSEEYQKFAAGLQESEQLADKSGAAWAVYYRALSDSARGAAAPLTSLGPALPSTGREPAAVELTARSAAPVPLIRYVGAWTYPTAGAHYHGIQPESVDLVVREENGQAIGKLSARFKLGPGSADNPEVHFDFTGVFGRARVQRFAIVNSSGTIGTLELIPGPAFNLLEVNFNIGGKNGDKPGTIRQGNFLLIKQ
jgi:hypothetical protein